MNDTTTVGIEVRADGTQEAARDLAVVEASIRKVGKGLGEAAQYIGSAKLEKPIAGLDELAAKCKVSSRHMQNLARMMREVERERAFRQLAQDANLSTLQLARLRAEMGDMRGALATLGNKFSSAKVAILAWAAAVAFGGKACLDAALQMDRLDKSYTSIYGSASAAQQQLSYLYDVSGRLGLQFQSTAEGAKTFFAAGRGSTLEKDLNSIFEAVSSAGTALSLSTDDMHGAFIALGQMISKGKVQGEELRGQLGERLRGAFQLAAKAMNMTTAQLDKFMADGKLTAEELLPKLAKAMQEDFGAAAEAAANGLQGQLNRLSTEWTRLKAEMLDADSAASAVGTLAQAMKSLADNGATVGAIISKVLQFAVWIAGVYAFIKALGGLVSVFTTLKTISSAVSFAGIVSGAGAIAVVVAAAAVAITSLCTSTATADEIFRKHQSTIDAYTKTMGEAADEVRNFTAEQDEAYRKSLERQRDVLKTDIAAASQGINNALSGIRFLSLDQIFSAEGTQFVEARSELESLGRELTKLGQNITQEDLDAYAAKVRAIDERMRAAGLATKAWNDAIDKLLYSNDAFVKNLSALIVKGLSVEDALRQLAAEAERTEVAVGTGWNIDIDSVTKGINAIEKSIRSMQSEMLGGKVFEKIVSSLPKEFPLEKAKEIFDIYQKTPNLEPWQRAGQVAAALGDQYAAMGDDAVKGINKLFSAGAELGKTQANYEGYQKNLRDAAKDHTSAYNQMENNLASYTSELNQTKSSIHSLQAQLATKPGEVFTREQNKIAADYRATVEKINSEATKYANKKGITKTQAEELKQSKLQEASLQRNLDLRLAQEKEEKHLADLAKDKYDFYRELEELTGQYGLSLQFQNKMISEQAKELERLQLPQQYIDQWKELKALQMSHDWSDGAQRAFLQYRADATDAAKGAEEAFSSLYSGMDSGWKSAWEQMIETGKVSLSSFRSVFASFLADLMHMAITRPITVQIAGVVSGMLGTGGVAYAAGGNGGSGGIGLGNLPFSSLLPDSWTSGVSSFLSYELPGTAPGISGLYGPTMGGGNLASGLSLGSALMYGGLGSLGYSLLGGALGLPQNKYSGITSGLGAGLGAWGASAALSGTALGATFGSAVPVVGTVIGAALGGLASSLFGGGQKTHPSVYTNVVDASLFGSDWEALMTQGAWTDRASVSDAAGIFKGLGEVANTTASSIMGFAQALPEEYQAQVLARLNAETVSFGRGSTAGRKGVTDYGPSTWNFQFHDEEQLQEVINTAGEDIQRVMLNALQRAMAGTDLSSMLAVDLSSTEGLDKAIQAINAINTVTEATANIKEPLSEMEQQAKAARAQLDEWTESMRSLGVNADYAGKLMEDYRHAYIDNVIESLDESLHPLSAYAQAVKAANEAVDQRKKALEIIGATEGQLAQVEAMRAEVVKQATEEMLRSFDQSVAQRWAAVNGNSDEVGRAISQANELRETIQQFGEGSAQVAELLKLHAAETAKAAQDAAKSKYDSLKAQMDALEQQRVQLQQQAIQEQINAINEQINTAKTLKSTWEGLDKSLGQSRYNLFAGSANLDAENRLGTVQAEFRRLSGLALGGDSDAAGQLAGVGTSLLDIVKQTAGTEEEYLDAFWAVNAQLKSAQDAAGAQVSAADKQLEALQGQLDVQNAALAELQGQSATLEEIEKQIAELRPLLDAAGDKAGVKAFARGGLAMPGWAVVGEEGPELVNFSQPGRVYTAADTAALFRSATPRGTSGESGGSREEVYELRRDMNILLNEVAKYGRRVSDLVELWDKEGMPGVRA
ncbi:tape measure protein [Bilophila wadsworthia]|uniref:tape measure protein n=1 Tax=Bilophila wadsworthia TaxID=35833 RepID=UPI0024332737|nr:tape measure protein [Bilophila wadsworthia]